MTDIVKADGSVEPFDSTKLEVSLKRAGASAQMIRRITEVILKTLSPGMSTHDIYSRAFRLLRKGEQTTAARYSLRRALFELGPTGHPFEDFIAELFKKEGWNVEWRKMVQGACVSHELDVYAVRGNEHLAAEVKYHNDPGFKTDVKVALYVKARFDDIWRCDPKRGAVCPIDIGYLITNTKFTEHAIQYARCAGIQLLGWTYPSEGNLYDRILAAGIYPVTALTNLRKAEKNILLEQGIVTIEMLKDRREALRSLKISPDRIGAIVAEIETLRAGGVHGVQ
jgi:hypothetical protein